MEEKTPRKRVDIVSLQLVKEKSTYYSSRQCNTPYAIYELFASFIEKKDREHLVVAGLNVKNEPTFIQIAHIGSIRKTTSSQLCV